MKRILCFLLALFLTFSLIACTDPDGNEENVGGIPGSGGELPDLPLPEDNWE